MKVLLIVVTLFCAYLACWGPTKRQGVDDIDGRINDSVVIVIAPNVARLPQPGVGEIPRVVSRGGSGVALAGINISSPAPLIIGCDEWGGDFRRDEFGDNKWYPSDAVPMPRKFRRYYFWFFGYVAKLPWERELR